MNWSHRLTAVLSIGFASMASMAGDVTSDAGFRPLASVTVNIKVENIPALRDTLRSFAASENLTFLEGEFYRHGRPVEQFYLKQGLEPAIYVHNFQERLRFESTAYSHGTEATWKPRWQRFVASLKVAFGPESVSGE